MSDGLTFLKRALTQAQLGKGHCSPNPAVGAVIVKDANVLAEGYHRGPGLAHAEVDALSKVGDEAKGATLYVTLEPCCHWGRTPPCTRLILERGISHVVYAFEDPNPVVSRKGVQELNANGVTCERIAVTDVDRFYESYEWWTRTKLPFVTAKLAMSLDGKIAGPGGARVQLTSELLQRETHRRRKDADAILTTSKTVLADDPQLNVRLGGEAIGKKIYLLDREGVVPKNATIFRSASEVVVCREPSLAVVLEKIGADGVHDLWVEAGGTLFERLAREGRLNRALLYVAPKWLGASAQSAFASAEFLASAKQFRWQGIGPDALCEVEF